MQKKNIDFLSKWELRLKQGAYMGLGGLGGCLGVLGRRPSGSKRTFLIFKRIGTNRGGDQ